MNRYRIEEGASVCKNPKHVWKVIDQRYDAVCCSYETEIEALSAVVSHLEAKLKISIDIIEELNSNDI